MDKIVLSKDVYQKTEIGKIPRDWEVKKINEIAEVNKENLSGNTPAEYEFYYYDLSSVDKGKVLHPTEKLKFADAPSRAKRLFKRNDVLMSTVRPNLQGFTYVDFDSTNSVCSTGFAVIAGKYESDSMYIYQNLFSYGITRQIQKLLVGSNYPAINSKDVENLKVPFPNDKKEREKIASILSTWDKAIELKEKLIEQKKEQKKGIMQKLLTGEVRLPGFDGEWKEVKLAKVVKKIKGKAVEYLEGGKFPAIDMDYLESGTFKNYSNDATVFAEKNDVLLLWDGSRAGMAFTGVEGAVGSTFVKLECKSIHNIFLQKHLEMNEQKIQRLREGSGIPHVPKDFLDYYKVKMPSMEEQRAIAYVLNSMDRDLDLLLKEVTYLKKQKQGLMQLLLTGKVRVKV